MKKKMVLIGLFITSVHSIFAYIQETRWSEGQYRDMSQRRDKWDLRTPNISPDGIPEAGSRLESKGVMTSETYGPGTDAYQAPRTYTEKRKIGKVMPRASDDPEIRAYQIPMDMRRKSDLGTPRSKIDTGAPPEMKAIAK